MRVYFNVAACNDGNKYVAGIIKVTNFNEKVEDDSTTLKYTEEVVKKALKNVEKDRKCNKYKSISTIGAAITDGRVSHLWVGEKIA